MLVRAAVDGAVDVASVVLDGARGEDVAREVQTYALARLPNVTPPAKPTAPEPAPAPAATAPTEELAYAGVEAGSGDDGWTHLGVVGSQISNQASFDPQNYGYRKLSDLVKASGLFEVKQEGKTIWVRDKPRKRAAAKKATG